ncbi:MAG: aminoglycoside phosphotransferase family protein [Magnetococcales bacterium]|nr:aminoglycoside phosphotransferase family protein [Magnetococcales bacterium]
MFLTAANLVHYLIGRGVVTAESVVKGDFMVAEVGCRNRNFKVIRNHSTSLFIKQMQDTKSQSISTLQQETLIYKAFHEKKAPETLKNLTPKFIDYDPGRNILIMELHPDTENLNSHHWNLKDFPESLERRFAKALANIHNSEDKIFVDSSNPPKANMPIPWIFTIHNNQYAMQNGSVADKALINIIKQTPLLTMQLDALAKEWQNDVLIHGDIKWDNILLTKGDKGSKPLLVIDWELAAKGDATWDVGGALQSFLLFWISGMPNHETQPVDQQIVEKGTVPLKTLQGGVQRFWHAYCEERNFSENHKKAFLIKSVRCAAARLIQTNYEYLDALPQMNHFSYRALQLSHNIMKDPKGASFALFGL